MYIQITLKSDIPVTHAIRKSYIDSLYGNVYEKKKGIIEKFNNSIGFKPVVSDICSDYPIVHLAEIESPDDYVSPEQMLYRALWIDLENNGIIKFVTSPGEEKHPVSLFSYNREEICKKFAKFLKKVYPDVEVELSYVKTFVPSVKDFVLNHFYQNLNFSDNIYEVECSVPKLLTEKELEEIYEILNEPTDYNWHIEQFTCDTCASHDINNPVHVMVEYS